MKDKLKRMKAWIENHSDELIIGGVYLGCAVFTGLVVKASLKHNAQVQEQLQQAIADGKTILPNADGSYWILDLDVLKGESA